MRLHVKLFFRDPLSADGYAVLEGDVVNDLRWESETDTDTAVPALPLQLLYEIEVKDDDGQSLTVDVDWADSGEEEVDGS